MSKQLKMQLDTLEGLDESLHELYVEKDGKFTLQLEGYEDPGALMRAKQHEKDARQKAEKELRDLRAEFDTFREEVQAERDEKSRKKGNIEDLDKSWQGKVDKLKSDHAAELEKLQAQIRKLTVDHTADTMAAELSDSPELLRDLIHKRLTVEIEADGTPKTRVLDASGALSATTVDELRDEFRANKKYAAIIRGSQANGGGSGGGGGGGATKAFKDMSEKERTDLARSNPAEYQRQLDAYKAESKTNY